ncbi:hypothetical protein DFH28DRAFT_1043393 [Melampsora americana]|nr:hypothetical protein DFH28DRAFT_1043393 [Melampsora americana]
MFYTRLLICISLVSLFQHTVLGQCLPLRDATPIDIEQCRKAFATYRFDKRGRLDNDGFKNKKTCGNCAISMSRASIDPKAKPSLDGYTKQSLEAFLNDLFKTCTIKGTKGKSMLPSIMGGATRPADGTFFSMEIEVGDMKPNECSSKRRNPKKE